MNSRAIEDAGKVVQPWETMRERQWQEMEARSEIREILRSESWQDIYFATIIYVQNFLDSRGFHEDYIRDACESMVSANSPFSAYFVSAFEWDAGRPYSRDDGVRFDVLADFCGLQDDALRFNFLMNFLVAVRLESGKLPGINPAERSAWKLLLEKNFILTMSSLKRSPLHR